MNIRKWLKEYSRDCNLKYSSTSTRSTYKSGVKKFLNHFRNEIEPKSIPNDKIKEWLLNSKTHNTRKHLQCAVNSFYTLTVNMPSKISKLPYPKKQKSLPTVIDKNHLITVIKNIHNLKHKAIIMLGFSCALRVSEVINLRMCDIDRNRMIIHIRNSKGNKDRIVKLSETLLANLEAYYRKYRPKNYLFNGAIGIKYSRSSCQKLIKNYLGKEYTFHTLRHSGATAMLENGTEINIIQKILGHSSIKTTMIYTHISTSLIQSVKAPM